MSRVDYTIVNSISNYYTQLVGPMFESDDLPLNSKMAYYEADGSVGGVPILGIRASKNLVFTDVSSAFPTLCRLLLHNYPKFISQMDSIQDKREKLIFISTNVNNIRPDFLQLFNSIIKMVIFSHIYNNYMDVNVLEFKKDSLLCTGVRLGQCISPELQLLLDGNFRFHNDDDVIVDYLRFDKTSVYWYKNGNVQVKGKYKDPPQFLVDKFLKNLNTISASDLNNIKQVYSRRYFIYCQMMGEDIDYFYKFGSKYLSSAGLSPSLDSSHPFSTMLFNFVYPLLEVFQNDA